MDKTNRDNDIKELLARYCDGNITEEERKLVEDWIDESEEHQKIIRQIYLIHLTTDSLSAMNQVDTEKALRNVNKRIRKHKIKIGLRYFERAAAILFLPLLSLSLYIFLPNEEKKPNLITIKTYAGMTTHFTLPDGSYVALNSGSSLTYPEFFTDNVRTVNLLGEAYFKVVNNPEQKFIISTPHDTKIRVLGTTFNVEAYPRDSTISTTLQEGSVLFKYGKDYIKMKPHEKIVYNANQNKIYKTTTTGNVETSWKDGALIFQKTPFQEILRMLEKRFNVEFIVSNHKIDKNTFTGSFTNQRLDRILEVFKISSNIKWRYIESKDSIEQKQKIEIY